MELPLEVRVDDFQVVKFLLFQVQGGDEERFQDVDVAFIPKDTFENIIE
jgi:hypothetical protein